MSQTNDFRQANNPDRVYYDILQHNIGRNTETPARFIETTDTPIINNTGDYKMSVVRFQIDTPNMPVLIVQPNQDKTISVPSLLTGKNYTPTEYKITLNYHHQSSTSSTPVISKSFFINWKPEDPTLYKPTYDEYKDGKHINYEYFYCYSYSYFFDFIVNQSIQIEYGNFIVNSYLFADLNGSGSEFNQVFSNWAYPPTFEWSESGEKVFIVVPPCYLTTNAETPTAFTNSNILRLGNVSASGFNYFFSTSITTSANFYTLISTFPAFYTETTTNYQLIFRTTFADNNFYSNGIAFYNWGYTSIPITSPPFSPTDPPTQILDFGKYLLKGEQEWSSIDLITPINSIVFISNTLPIVSNQQSATKSKDKKDSYIVEGERSTTQHILMITDLMSNQQGYRPNLLYVPSGQYRYITLTGNQPLNQIDINVYYQLKTGDLIPFMLTTGGTASIKILFEKVILGETKTLQFANMSMRDLKL